MLKWRKLKEVLKELYLLGGGSFVVVLILNLFLIQKLANNDNNKILVLISQMHQAVILSS